MALALFALVWIALTFLGFDDDRIFGYRQLIDHHAVVTAHATSICGDHGRVSYAFEVQGKTFIGDTYRLEQPCSEIHVGLAFAMNYNPYDPTVSSPMPPEAAYADQLKGFCFKVLFVSLLVYLAMRYFFPKSSPN